MISMKNLHWLPDALHVAVALRRVGIITPIVEDLAIAPLVNELLLIAETVIDCDKSQFLQRMRDISVQYYGDVVSALSAMDSESYEECRSMIRQILFG